MSPPQIARCRITSSVGSNGNMVVRERPRFPQQTSVQLSPSLSERLHSNDGEGALERPPWAQFSRTDRGTKLLDADVEDYLRALSERERIVDVNAR